MAQMHPPGQNVWGVIVRWLRGWDPGGRLNNNNYYYYYQLVQYLSLIHI